MRFAHRCAGVPPHNAHAIAILDVRSRRLSAFASPCRANHAVAIALIYASLTDPDAKRRAVLILVRTRLPPSSYTLHVWIVVTIGCIPTHGWRLIVFAVVLCIVPCIPQNVLNCICK